MAGHCNAVYEYDGILVDGSSVKQHPSLEVVFGELELPGVDEHLARLESPADT